MNDVLHRLQGLFVFDVMSKTVIFARQDQTLADLATLFAKNDISSAPVVDEKGCCIGIISAVDYWKAVTPGGPRNSSQRMSLDACLVTEIMTSAVQSVLPTRPLLEAAMVMNSAHLHRLPVIDAQNQLVGVLSTMDIVSALINAVEEVHGPIVTK